MSRKHWSARWGLALLVASMLVTVGPGKDGAPGWWPGAWATEPQRAENGVQSSRWRRPALVASAVAGMVYLAAAVGPFIHWGVIHPNVDMIGGSGRLESSSHSPGQLCDVSATFVRAPSMLKSPLGWRKAQLFAARVVDPVGGPPDGRQWSDVGVGPKYSSMRAWADNLLLHPPGLVIYSGHESGMPGHVDTLDIRAEAQRVATKTGGRTVSSGPLKVDCGELKDPRPLMQQLDERLREGAPEVDITPASGPPPQQPKDHNVNRS